MTLTKIRLVEALQQDFNLSKAQATSHLTTLFELLKSRLEDGDDLLISGFGKFCVKGKRKRRGRNPATGHDLELRARKVVTFKCSPVLARKINGNSR